MVDASRGKLKRVHNRIVPVLMRLMTRGDVVREDTAEYNADDEYEYEYRDADYGSRRSNCQNKRMSWRRKSGAGLLAGLPTAHRSWSPAPKLAELVLTRP